MNGQWRVIRDCARVGEPGVGGDERFCTHEMGTFNIYAEVRLPASFVSTVLVIAMLMQRRGY